MLLIYSLQSFAQNRTINRFLFIRLLITFRSEYYLNTNNKKSYIVCDYLPFYHTRFNHFIRNMPIVKERDHAAYLRTSKCAEIKLFLKPTNIPFLSNE